jgi:hypothetical protein
MRRRDFVKAIATAPIAAKELLGAPLGQHKNTSAAASDSGDPEVPRERGLLDLGPVPIVPVVPDAVAQTDAQFFTAQQLATLRRMSEIMLPPLKGHPGAAEVGTPEFLDFLIGVSPADRQEVYQSGLDRLNAESMQRFKKPFAALENTEADQLLRPWMRSWIPDHPPAEPYAMFINVAHMDIRTATINSQAWNQAMTAVGRKEQDFGLYWYPIDPDTHRANSTPPVSSHMTAHS